MFYTYYVKAENKYYFGSRTPEFMLNRDAKDDFMIHYFTSTTDKRLREIIRKGEYEKAEIIREYTDRQECLKDEERLIKLFWAFYGRLNCWNHFADMKFSMSGTQRSIESREKQRETYNNKSDEEKEEINKRISEAYNNKSDEEKEEIQEKRSKSIKEAFKNMSDEKKQNRSKSIKEALKNMSDEKKQNRSKKLSESTKEAWNNKTDEKKQEIIKKRGEAIKGKPKKKFQWKTTDGKIVVMGKLNVNRWHPDWILIE